MVLRSNVAPPHAHHVDLVEALLPDVLRELRRLGMMRSLVVVRLGASGGYRIGLVPAADVRLGLFAEFGISATESLGLIDEVLNYDVESEAAVMVVETNPVDGAIASFVPLDLPTLR